MEQIGDIPLTAYATAYHRMLESQSSDPLIVDPYAEPLVKSITTEQHSFSFQRRDYTIVRTHFIDNLICSWLSTHPTGQIVLLGAGLDCRAYRLSCIPTSTTVFEVDVADTIAYKSNILNDFSSICNVERIPVDFTERTGIEPLQAAGLDPEQPILWIMEGLLYYLDQQQAILLLGSIREFSDLGSIIADICVPILVEVKFGLFMRYFQWGLDLEQVIPFFDNLYWSVQAIYADEVALDRDVGQKGMIFIYSDNNWMNDSE